MRWNVIHDVSRFFWAHRIDDFVYYYHRENRARLNYSVCVADDMAQLMKSSIQEVVSIFDRLSIAMVSTNGDLT